MCSFNWSFLEQILPQILNVTVFYSWKSDKIYGFLFMPKGSSITRLHYNMAFFLHGQIKCVFQDAILSKTLITNFTFERFSVFM